MSSVSGLLLCLETKAGNPPTNCMNFAIPVLLVLVAVVFFSLWFMLVM